MKQENSSPYALEPHLASCKLEELLVCLVNYLYPELTNKHLLVDLFSRIPIKDMENFEWSATRITQIFSTLREKKLVNKEHKLPIKDGHALTIYFTKLHMGKEFIKQLPARLRSSRAGVVSYSAIQKTQTFVDFYLNEVRALESAKKAYYPNEVPILFYAENPPDEFYKKLKGELQLWITRLRIRKALNTPLINENFAYLDIYVSLCLAKNLYSSSFLAYFAFVKYDLKIYEDILKVLKVSQEDGRGYFIDTLNLFNARSVEDCVALTKNIKLSFRALRKVLGKKNVKLENIFELFYLFTLAKAQNNLEHKEALKKEFVNYVRTHIMNNCASLLEKLMSASFSNRMNMDIIERDLAFAQYDYVLTFVICYPQLKNEEENEQRYIALVKEYFENYKENIPFLALVIAQNLSRLLPDSEAKIYRDFKEQYEMFDFSSLFMEDLSWEKRLEAITSFFNSEENQNKKKATQNPKRLVWNVSFVYNEINPYEQSFSKNAWTKGRKLSVSRLRDEKESISYLSEQDKEIIKQAAKKDYWRDMYEIDFEKAMPLLIGHELVFNEENNEKIVLELEEVELKVDFKKNQDIENTDKKSAKNADEEACILSLELPGSQIGTYIRKEDDVYKVTPISPQHIQLKELIGKEKLVLPKQAHEKVMQLISSEHSQVKVSTTQKLSTLSQEMVNTKPTLRLNRIAKEALGFEVQAIVYPLGRENSSFIPTFGAQNFVAKYADSPTRIERNFQAEKEAMEELLVLCPSLKENLFDEKYFWRIEEPEIAYNSLLEMQENNLDLEWLDSDPIKLSSSVSQSNMQLKMRKNNSWFTVEGNLQVDEEIILDMVDLLKKIRKHKGRFIPMANGRILSLTEEFRRVLDRFDAITQEDKDDILLHPLAAPALDSLFAEDNENIDSDDLWKEWQKKLAHFKANKNESKIQIPSALQAELRDYQVEGFEWLASLIELNAGACLADDMGLGKTLQTITLILHLIRTSVVDAEEAKAILILAPTSVCHNWESEIHKFAPQINCKRLTAQISKKERAKTIEELEENDVLIVGYGLLTSEMPSLVKKKFKLIVFDEAQALKNSKTLRSKSSAKLQADSKIALTGTPIENSLEDLWSIFNIINPGLLGSLDNFNDKFNLAYNENNTARNISRNNLRALVKSFILRRTKNAVLEELPARTEQTLIIEPSEKERAMYEAIRLQALQNIEKAKREKGENASKFLILAELTKLRRVCCNPKLIDPYTDIESSKLAALLELIKELRQNNHQALIFSQFTSHLKIVYKEIQNLGINTLYLDGSVQEKKRAELVQAFQANKADIFCISLKAGGQGLNLTAADYVIHLDPWWNPAVEDQASDRAHRMGQTRPVTVYRLIMQDSVEEKILDLHASKRELAADVLANTHSAQKLNLDELMKLFDVYTK